jgi:predicted RNA-binding protein with PUA-like domain
VTLDQIKAREELAEMVLVKNSRLSVQPVTRRRNGGSSAPRCGGL